MTAYPDIATRMSLRTLELPLLLNLSDSSDHDLLDIFFAPTLRHGSRCDRTAVPMVRSISPFGTVKVEFVLQAA